MLPAKRSTRDLATISITFDRIEKEARSSPQRSDQLYSMYEGNRLYG